MNSLECGVASLIKLAVELGIEWHVFVDGDLAGAAYAATARGYLAGIPEARRITVLPQADLEQALWHHGYDQVYVAAAGAPLVPPPADPIPHTIKRAIKATSKPHLATAVVDAAKQPGAPGLPPSIQTALTAAIDNARL